MNIATSVIDTFEVALGDRSYPIIAAASSSLLTDAREHIEER